MRDISKLSKEVSGYAVALRRHFRSFPELAFQEFATQKRVMSELAALGLEARPAAGTGVIAQLDGRLPGKIVAVRADMDALPLRDETDKEYCSENFGFCHACGHDAHMAMALSLAKIFSQLKDELAGSVRFLFEPGEELLPGGAQGLIEAGALEGVSSIIGAHIWQPIAVGRVGFTYGPIMAAIDDFNITIKGRGGHGSMPHQTIDPIAVAAQIALALKAIVPTHIDSREIAVLSIGQFHAGNAFNVIPDTASLSGNIRTFNEDVRRKIHEEMENICRGFTMAAKAEYILKITRGYSAVLNHAAISALIKEAAAEVLGADKVDEIKPVLGAEDFAYYLEKIPGAFFLLGTGNPQKGIVYPHHHPKFDLDEDSMPLGIEIMARCVMKLLQQ